jgi:hypothetical protein
MVVWVSQYLQIGFVQPKAVFIKREPEPWEIFMGELL